MHIQHINRILRVTTIFLVTAFCSTSFADTETKETPRTNSFPKSLYASIQYYGDIFTNMGTFRGYESIPGLSNDAVGYSENGTPVLYDPKYKTDYIAGGVSVGVATGWSRFEIEGQYSNVVIDNSDFSVKSMATYVELPRNTSVAGEVSSTSDPLYVKNKNAFSITSPHAVNGILKPPTPAYTLVIKEDLIAAKLENNGMSMLGGFLNFGYELGLPVLPISPFFLLGAGVAQTTFMGATKYGLAYQAKIGLNYNITGFLQMFIAYNYRGTLTQEYENISLTTPILHVPESVSSLAPDKEIQASKSATVETRFGVHGIMAGLLVKF